MTTVNHYEARRSREQWQQLLDEQRRSGLTQRQFCRSKDISVSSFQNWKRKLTQTGHDDAWLEVGQIPLGTASGWDIELELGNGVMLRLRRI